jgi:hypothetical protein
MVKDSVLRTLEVLKNVDWFSRVDQEIHLESSMLGKIERCYSWDEALEGNNIHWRNIKLRAQNQLTMFLDANHHELYQTWNNVVNEINPLIDEIFQVNPIDVNLNKVVDVETIKKITIQDIRRLLIEASWSHLAEPAFFAPVTFWYIKGHFPCGWRGEFPNGKLLVF